MAKGIKTKEIDRGFKKIMIELEKLKKKPFVKIGYPAASEKSNEEHAGDEFVTVLDVAIFSEFGTIYSPERSFIRASFDNNKKKYQKLNKELLIKIYAGSTTVEKALDILGITIENDIKKFIADGDVSPESIRALRQGGKTLWDTGQLINSLTFIKVMNP